MLKAAETAVQAYDDILIALTTSYDLRYANLKSRPQASVHDATTPGHQGAFWHPYLLQDPKIRALGSAAVAGLGELNNTNRTGTLVGNNSNISGKKNNLPAVAAPTGYTAIWKSSKNSDGAARMEGSVWRPIAPSGYVSLGDVAGVGCSEPSTDDVWCVRADLTATGKFAAQPMWSGFGFAAWQVELPSGSDAPNDDESRTLIDADTFFVAVEDREPDASLARVLSLPKK